MFYSLITIPSPSDVFATTAVYSSAMFNELLTPALMMVGCLIGAMIIIILIRSFVGACEKIAEMHAFRKSNYPDTEEGYNRWKEDNF